MEIISWLKKESLKLVVIVFPFVFLAIFWQDLPAQIPMHWNRNGEIDGYGSKLSLLGLGGINLLLFGLFMLWPHLNSKRQHCQPQRGKRQIMQMIMHFFITYVFMLIGIMALGYKLQTDLVIKYGVIVLLLILGIYLGTVRRNDFMGIRTCWALSSDYVWQKTHRFTAKLWVLGSLLMIIYSNFWEKKYPWIFFGYIGVLAVVPVAYSYLVYKKEPQGQFPSSEE